MSSKSFGIVCGLKSEAETVRAACEGLPVELGVSGANADRAEKIATEFCDQGVGAILSVGVSGGLDPTLEPGDLVIGATVKTAGGGSFDASPILLANVLSVAGEIRPQVIYGSDMIVSSASEKAVIYASSASVAVDMESHGVARAAQKAGIPFIAIRAIADPAARALPPAALNAVAPDGSTRIFKTLAECAKAPGQFPALLKLGSDSQKALATLKAKLGPMLRALETNA